MGPTSGLTIAPRGHGHSLEGQAQAHQGVVINMESLGKSQEMRFHINGNMKTPYVDVSAGELWINILHESLSHGYAPKSWTDYLHLTVGGTLSNAGISGQAFRHGPQINNVHQLQVVTGLGQFGIITRAHISLEPAPKMVKWMKVLYMDFTTFTKDQEQLISSNSSFDYVEGFVLINQTGHLNNWRSSFKNKDPALASRVVSNGKPIFCLEIAKYYKQEDIDTIDQVML
ncbi:hypothetical protein M8C21_003764 [Ambrosia artemisiifolia]|uniref:cytokinin dehydrogenase n=1 Tax=Ambrosia artemisiifolia TaxID=4212 RepID=A0AAD5CPX6_AMBAR|nr:hypothetical protein M8C21_003764 [Ambrosia artemisiifolia]